MGYNIISTIKIFEKNIKLIFFIILNINLYAGGACSVKKVKPKKNMAGKYILIIKDKINGNTINPKEAAKNITNEKYTNHIFQSIVKLHNKDLNKDENEDEKYTTENFIKDIYNSLKSNFDTLTKKIKKNDIKKFTQYKEKLLDKINYKIEFFIKEKGLLDLSFFSYCLYKINLEFYKFITDGKISTNKFFTNFTYSNIVKNKKEIYKKIAIEDNSKDEKVVNDIMIDFNDLNLTYTCVDIMNYIKDYVFLYIILISNCIVDKFPMLCNNGTKEKDKITIKINDLLRQNDFGDSYNISNIFKILNVKNYDSYKVMFNSTLQSCQNAYTNIKLIKKNIFNKKDDKKKSCFINEEIISEVGDDNDNNDNNDDEEEDDEEGNKKNKEKTTENTNDKQSKVHIENYLKYYKSIIKTQNKLENYILNYIFKKTIEVIPKSKKSKALKRKIHEIFSNSDNKKQGLKKILLESYNSSRIDL